ncbi:MAG TPA: threonine/serine exporter family protein [Actinocrinis sp.]|nr:threonine/serine exporter family protein [Actinocrinis sp.]
MTDGTLAGAISPDPDHGPAPRPGTTWSDHVRTLLRTSLSERPDGPVPAAGAQPVNVRRVLDLALRIGELLSSVGESSEEVEAAMLGVALSYGLERCDTTVTFTLLTISHQATLTEPAWTASRSVRRRVSDYNRLAGAHTLLVEINAGRRTVEEAYAGLAEIRRAPDVYPGWLVSAATSVLAGSAAVLVGGSWLVFLTACVAALAGDGLARLLAVRALPEFYQFVVAAMPAAGLGVLLTLLGADVRASAVITGGLFALFPGRALVASVQDGLTGFYITSMARLLEVLYLSAAIICGVALVLHLGLHFGVVLDPDAVAAIPRRPLVQLLAAAVLALTYGILLQVRRSVLLYATLGGGFAWGCAGALGEAGFPRAVAILATTGLLGLGGQLVARHAQTSGLPYTIPALCPLLPGSPAYLGLLSIVDGKRGPGFDYLFTAVSLALALAIGVNLGGELARLLLPARPGQVTGLRTGLPRLVGRAGQGVERGSGRGGGRWQLRR